MPRRRKELKINEIQHMFKEIKNSRVFMMNYSPELNGHIGVFKKLQKRIPDKNFYVLYDKRSKKLVLINPPVYK